MKVQITSDITERHRDSLRFRTASQSKTKNTEI